MSFHRSFAELRRNAFSEWSTWLGIAAVCIALLSFTSAELAEYEARVGHAAPIVLGLLGVFGILKRDRGRPDADRPPPC